MKIAVYAASSPNIDDVYINEVFKLGSLIAQSSHCLVFGGGAQGLMGAAARGAYGSGGELIGIAPAFFDQKGILCKNCTEFYYPETMRERKKMICEMSDAFVICPGGFGTFDELFEVLTAKQLSKHNKAIVILNVSGYYDEMLKAIDTFIEKGFIKPTCKRLFFIARNADEAIKYINEYEPENFTPKELKNLR